MGCTSAKARILDTERLPGGNFARAAFRLWLQDDGQPLTGVLALVPGSNGDGRPWVDDPAWQQFAVRHHLALLGCHLTDKPHVHMNIEEYARADGGSGEALVDSLRELAIQVNHPELADAPLMRRSPPNGRLLCVAAGQDESEYLFCQRLQWWQKALSFSSFRDF